MPCCMGKRSASRKSSKKDGPRKARLFIRTILAGYFAFGVSACLASLLTLPVSFFTSGVPLTLGEPVGDATGLGLATTTGVGLAGGLGGSGFADSHAAENAAAIANVVVKTIGLLIVFLLFEIKRGPKAVRWQTSAAGLTSERLSAKCALSICHSSSTLRRLERVIGENLQNIFSCSICGRRRPSSRWDSGSNSRHEGLSDTRENRPLLWQ